MRNTRALLIALLLTGLMIGCGTTVSNPTDTGNPGSQDTSGNNNDTTNYGTKFFQSSAATPWLVSGPVHVNNGVILGNNQDSVTVSGSCQYNGMVNFGSSADVYFVWQGGATNGGTIKLSVSSDGSTWDTVPYTENGAHWEVGQVAFLFDQTSPLTFKFDFTLPAGSQARIPEVRAFGR